MGHTFLHKKPRLFREVFRGGVSLSKTICRALLKVHGLFRLPYQISQDIFQLYAFTKATPHKARLTAWQRIYLHIFRHLARKLLAGLTQGKDF